MIKAKHFSTFKKFQKNSKILNSKNSKILNLHLSQKRLEIERKGANLQKLYLIKILFRDTFTEIF